MKVGRKERREGMNMERKQLQEERRKERKKGKGREGRKEIRKKDIEK